VLDRRSDTPPRLARLVDAMLQKAHDGRPSMDEVGAELGAVDAPAAGNRTVVVPRRRALRRSRPRSAWPLVFAALGVLLLAGATAGLLLPEGEKGSAAAPPGAIELEAVGAKDPKGDGEHDDTVSNATDGIGETYWTTSRYSFPNGGFGKEGVGLRLDASDPPRALVVESETPGFTAEVRSGDQVLAPARQVGTRTTFELPEDLDQTNLLLWITNRGDNQAVRINEIAAR
jgi:hypothetical protein